MVNAYPNGSFLINEDIIPRIEISMSFLLSGILANFFTYGHYHTSSLIYFNNKLFQVTIWLTNFRTFVQHPRKLHYYQFRRMSVQSGAADFNYSLLQKVNQFFNRGHKCLNTLYNSILYLYTPHPMQLSKGIINKSRINK